MIIDAHQHIWDLRRSPYRWCTPDMPLFHKSFSFEDSLPVLTRNAVDATVLVQADDHDGDTDLMLEVASAYPQVVAVVAYVPLDQPVRAASRLSELRLSPWVVGIRNLIHDRPDPDFLARPEVDDSLTVLEEADMTFDIVTRLPRHLEHVIRISERHPTLRIVLDHLGRPPLGSGSGAMDAWRSMLTEIAQNPLVHAKVSGLYPESQPGSWQHGETRQVVADALEIFGPSRLMYGGDWPICVAAGGYDDVRAAIVAALDDLSPKDAERIWSETARRFYRIAPGHLEAALDAAGRSSDSIG